MSSASSSRALSFSPTSAVRNSSRRWMEGGTTPDLHNNNGKKTTTTVSINHDALDKFSNEITQSILANQSLEVTEWDADGWHYTGANYQKQKGATFDGDERYRELMRMERVALYILTLDAINFCFWPLSSSDEIEKKSDNITRCAKNGLEYEHLAIALRKVAEADDGVTDQVDGDGRVESRGTSIILSSSSYALSPVNLSTLTPAKLHSMLQPHFPPSSTLNENDSDPDNVVLVQYELPNMKVRCQLLNELGKGLLEKHGGSALHMIAKAKQSADALVGIMLDTFPGFRDFVDTDAEWGNGTSTTTKSTHRCEWESAKTSPSSVIHFYKRAQIAIADIWAALGRHHDDCKNSSSSTTTLVMKHDANHLQICCQFSDVDLITTFPDYRVPQILRHVDVLQYETLLAKLVDDKVELDKSGIDEVSIRAGTVVAVEEIVQRVKKNIIVSRSSVATTTAAGCIINSGERSQGDLQRLADDVSAVTVDWYLWQKGEKLDRLNMLGPHHRVRTTYY